MSSPIRQHTQFDSPLGVLTLVSERSKSTDVLGLAGIYFEQHKHAPKAADIGKRVSREDDELLDQTASELSEYFTGARQTFSVPLATAGDEFSQQVWKLLREIPYGETTTYGALASALGNVRLAQRVGQSVGRNPISIVVPCHRVIGANGSLTGFAGGLERKQALLFLEEPAQKSAERLF